MFSESLKNIIFSLNGIIHRLCLGDIGKPCKISPFAIFRGRTLNINIGSNTSVFGKAYFDCDSCGSITIGSHCEIHAYARLMTYGGSITMGDLSSINPYSILYGHGGLEIGSMVRIAAHVVVIPGSHGIQQIDIPIMQQEILNKKIVIKDNVWIGAGAKILGGVTIHTGAVVGANAVVTRDVPENGIVAGVPAKIIRFRAGSPREPVGEKL